MWTEVYMSQDKLKAETVKTALDKQNIMTMLRVAGEDDFAEGVTYILLVPKTELEAAQEIIFELA